LLLIILLLKKRQHFSQDLPNYSLFLPRVKEVRDCPPSFGTVY
jgi:hypothetical protein